MHPCTRYVYGQRALSRVWQLSCYYHDQRRDRGDCAHLLNNASSPNVFSILFLLLLKNGSLQNPLLQNCRRLSLHFSPRIISLCGKCSGTITFLCPTATNLFQRSCTGPIVSPIPLIASRVILATLLTVCLLLLFF